MAQLHFKYGAMSAGKSIELMKIVYNYERQGKKALVLTPAIDNRYGVGKITTRIMGMQINAIAIDEKTNVYEMIEKGYLDYDCILIDEAQFLKKKTVKELSDIVDDFNIPVMAFGLKNTFRCELFEGSYYLLVYAHKIEEIKTECVFCTKKATMNMRCIDGIPVYEGDDIQIGGDESYLPTCTYHYKKPIIEKINLLLKK